MAHPAALSVDELLKTCDVVRTRRSGPGGQHRNKVETAVVLTHRPTGIQAEASERRSQPENLAVAAFRLRVRLAIEIRQPVIPELSPSELWLARCGSQIRINPKHDDFPALLAEVLDVLADQDWDVSVAAEWLGCSTSQLGKFLQLEPQAFRELNKQRQSRGLRPLKPS
jgi:hypothetical protein